MLAPAKVFVEAMCPVCMGKGREDQREDSLATALCRGCFGTGKIDVAVSEECEDAIWDEAVSVLEMVGVERHEEAYAYRWRDGGWAVVTFDGAKMGGIQ